MKLNNTDMQKILQKMTDKSTDKSTDKIPACAYARYSSEHQREESVEAQFRIIGEYADKNGYEIVEYYADRAVSGKTTNRPEFRRMLDDISASDCKFKACIVHKMDRFSRSAGDAIQYKEILADYGIELVSTAERIKDDANGKLLFGIMSNINQYYIDNLSNEVMKGMKENAYKCLWNGGIPPLGYSVDPVTKTLVINESEAIIVRKIFEMSAEGYGYNTIIKELNACGYTTKAGKPFGKNSLYDLIKNERYYGLYCFNKRAKRTRNNTRNMRRFKDESEIIRIENGNPAIVSKELWERANASRKLAATFASNAKNDYILSGLIKCGECGHKMSGNVRYGSTKKYLTYRCNKQSNQLNCTCKEIHADVLEEFVLNNLISHFTENEEIVDTITEQVNQKLKEQTEKDGEIVVDAKNALKGLNLAKNNLVEAIAHTGFNATLGEKLNNIEKQITEYQAIINDYEENKKTISISKDEVKDKLEQLRENILDKKHIDQLKLLLRSYISEIVVDNHSVKATFTVAFFVLINNEEVEICYSHTVTDFRKRIENKGNS